MADDISPQRKLALEVIEAYRSWDLDKIMAFRTDNCIHEIAPSMCFFLVPPVMTSFLNICRIPSTSTQGQ